VTASVPQGRWLCVDPGETTGWSVWKGEKLLGGGQTPLWDFAHCVWDALAYEKDMRRHPGELLGEGERSWLGKGVTPEDNDGDFELIVCEKFALYPWEAKNLAFDEFRTVQLIGALTFMATLFDVTMHKQPATIKEPALNAGAKELFTRPLHENRHQNDSIMHGWFYLLVECKGLNLGVADGTVR
jgi:hypothetical protein